MTTKVLATFPGKYGDILWALPTVRAVSEAAGAPVDLIIAGAFESIVPLLERQPYLRRVWALEAWQVQDTAPITPRVPPTTLPGGQPIVEFEPGIYDRVLHLGYDGWPGWALPETTYRRAVADLACDAPHLLRALPDLDLNRPWITAPFRWVTRPYPVAVGFTDEHFELKFGLWSLLFRRALREQPDAQTLINVSHSPRWETEGEFGGFDWETAASAIAQSEVFLGDCSALHVLACALGVPCVLMEPAPARHHPIFWPFGTRGPQVTQVLGGDGQWTWDARHGWETIQAVAARRRATTGVSGS